MITLQIDTRGLTEALQKIERTKRALAAAQAPALNKAGAQMRQDATDGLAAQVDAPRRAVADTLTTVPATPARPEFAMRFDPYRMSYQEAQESDTWPSEMKDGFDAMTPALVEDAMQDVAAELVDVVRREWGK
jgi:hypothetical protein